MALMTCEFFSEALGMNTSMRVIVPQEAEGQIGMAGAGGTGKLPCLYLLHGLSDDDSTWCRRTSIERYVAPLRLAVVMPNVHRSFYCDMEHGYKYWTFISEELPRLAGSFFNISDRREDTFVAGLSMGGYGAFKLALNHPDRYAAAASLSGVLDMAARAVHPPGDRSADIELVFGAHADIAGSGDDLLARAKAVSHLPDPKPSLYQCCGTDDFLYEDNIKFRDQAQYLGLDLTYEEEPDDHNWGYWDQQIQKVLDWLPLGAGAEREA
jgi:putative tributyrin esterase